MASISNSIKYQQLLYGTQPSFNTTPAQPTTPFSLKFDPTLDFKVAEPRERVAHPHLTLPLSKPMHQYSEAELHGLIAELEGDGFLEQETSIAEIVDAAYMVWRGERSNPSPNLRYTTHLIPAATQTAFPHKTAYPAITATTKTVSVHVPASIPEKYVKAFIERMVRDQIEEG